MTRRELISTEIELPKDEVYYQIKRIIDNLPKPVDGLGKFEDLICKIGSMQDTIHPDIKEKALVVMCADNGILEEGVTEVGGYMTGLICKKMADGEASVCYMADIAGVKVMPVDIGINGDIEGKNLIVNKIAKGTKNFVKEPAMTEEQVLEAIKTGMDIVTKLKSEGYGLICTGDMGIGNTTTAVALICAILEGDPEALAGRGAGASDAIHKRKLDAIFEGLHIYGYDGSAGFSSLSGYDSPYGMGQDAGRIVEMVMNLGGLDIAGLIGIFIGGAINHIPVVVDGILPAAAALAADNIIPGCKSYMLGSHFGKEPATEIVFEELEIDPVINADMAMGEGVGAVMLMPMLDMVMSMYNNLGTEEEESLNYD
ncbi:MAG: nicotinate-nucleotide--dimethylbenzimidazole phosphoribosyltransferase [Lachnospiraceae bacterium]|nr:nicotinate-nucleotide--dimethylbenzimidazole phosphoribosyltransferase [Lachnospiraceae bacterium]